MIDPKEFLFIEPILPPSERPIIDELTLLVTDLFRRSRSNGDCFRGWHTCSCGAFSSNTNYMLPRPGLRLTNSLCVHYVAYHRHELTLEELADIRVEACRAFAVPSAQPPTESELCSPRTNRGQKSKGIA